MSVDVEYLQARNIALELMMRSILTGLLMHTRDPFGELDRMSREFHAAIGSLQIDGADQEGAAQLRRSVMSVVDNNIAMLRHRIVAHAERQAAQAGSKN